MKMEQSQKFMWLKRTPFSASLNNSFHQTWEEKAFAEDATRILGHCIWPPRSYSCTFCKREFRSAQALGGHMNIHRRERAMLKQTTCDQHPGINSFSNVNPSSFRSSAFAKQDYSLDNSLIAQEPQRFFTQEAQTSCGVFGVDFPRHEVKNAVENQEELCCLSCDRTSVRINHKRARTSFLPSSLSSILNSYSTKNGHSHVDPEGLDLELRLGDLPKVD